ncbi:MAG TPA: AraC family transcriptional regulator [Steroidobacteraceae bacterium]|nr:AraC family transcriptional regulator [Steroidobacteraceae bacterium]
MGECEKLERTLERYQERFARVLAHIEDHSESALSTDDLSGIAAFSRHHFHRQFSGFLGMSAYRYLQFMRMRRASWRLAFRPELSVNEIALSTGYEGPEAFARAFRQYAGRSPSEFRDRPKWPEWHSRFRPFMHLRQITMKPITAPGPVRVATFPATRVGKLEHRGSAMHLGDSIRRFIDWRRANKLPPHLSATFNIVHNDPDETPSEDFRFDLCAATDLAIEPNEAGVVEFVIPAGRCAVLRHRGSDDQLGRSIMHLYASWLPTSGEELRDFPLFMQRLKFFPDVPDGEAETDIFLPLK